MLATTLGLVVLDGWLAVSARAIARAATVQVTRPAGLLREGNALANTSFSLCFMVGPAVGAGIVSLAGTTAALLANAGLFGAIGLVLATTSGLSGHQFTDQRSSGRLSSAFAYVRQHRPVRSLFLVEVAGLLFFTISIPVEIVFVKHSLHAGTNAYGALLSAWGAGTIAGSAIYARWRTATLPTLIVGGSTALGLGFVLMAVAPSLGLAIAGAVLAGIGNGVWAVAARTALQEQVEDSWMALVMICCPDIAGSTVLEENVIMAGQTGSSGHLTIRKNAIVWAQSGVGHDVPEGAIVSGSPAFDSRDWLRAQRGSPSGSPYHFTLMTTRILIIDDDPSLVQMITADLEEEGYLMHPHTSAGRVPS